MKLITSIIILILSCTSNASHILEVDTTRVVEIAGVVDGSVLTQADLIYTLSKESSAPIYILINSPGGSVYVGLQFINAMEVAKERGVRFICAVPGIAMSMAFQFLLYCDERYALPHALLLWHPVRISGFITLTPEIAAELTADLERTERLLYSPLEDVLNSVGMIDSDLRRHYLKETIWTAEELVSETRRFITLIKDIEGVSSVWTPGGMTNLMEEATYRTRPGEMIYIQDKYIHIQTTGGK